MSVRQFFWWAVAVVAIVAGVVGLVRMDQKKSAARVQQHKTEVFAVRADDHVVGDKQNARVTIIEYSDFQCPACAHAYDYFKDIDTTFPQGVAFVYRHFPLTLIHKNADEAARAAEAAARQGKFHEMHNVLFERQDAWSDRVDVEPVFAGYAEELGLDRAQFLADYNSDVVKARVKRDADEAKALGLSGTPTVFINGQQIQLPSSKEALYDALRARLAPQAQEDEDGSTAPVAEEITVE